MKVKVTNWIASMRVCHWKYILVYIHLSSPLHNVLVSLSFSDHFLSVRLHSFFYDSNFFITSGPISSKLGKNHLQVKYLSKMKNHTFFERKVIRIFFLNVDIFQNIFLSRKWCITVYTGIGRILSRYVRYWKKLPELDI